MLRFIELKCKKMLHTIDSSFQDGGSIWELFSNLVRVYIHLASIDMATQVIKIVNASDLHGKELLL